MGGGHNATAAAIEEAVGDLWPGSEVRRLDTLRVLGPGVGGLFRAIYVGNVQRTPWLYEFFYASLWRHRWFAAASKRLTGSWSGRRLAGHIDRFDPDLIVSTYPLGSAGLAWLRRHRGLAVPVAAYVSDFAPHPFWVYADVDVTFVMDDAAIAAARVAEPSARVLVSAPPVVRAFAPGDRGAAREALGLERQGFVALVTSGAYGFGDVCATVDALLDASPQVRVVAVCGRDDIALAALQDQASGQDRLHAVGWTDRMRDYVRAADLVVTNAGGATALEGISVGRAVVLASPIAAHGTANSDLMVVSGLADCCRSPVELTGYVRSAVDSPGGLRRLERRADAHVRSHDFRSGLRRFASGSDRSAARRSRPWPMRAADAFFAHVESADLLQETGAVLELADITPGRPLRVDQLRRELAARAPGLAAMRRRLVRAPRPGWLLEDDVDVAALVDEVVLERGADRDGIDATVDQVWSRPLPMGAAWSMTLVCDERSGRTVLAVKMHHCLGDGISALGLLDRLMTTPPEDPLLERGGGSSPAGGQARTDGRTWVPQVRAVGTGLWSLATRHRPAVGPLTHPIVSPDRCLVRVPLPTAGLQATARANRAHLHEVGIALLADALARTLPAAGLVRTDRPLVAMLPIAMRAPVLDRTFGNWTGSVALDLPMSAMSSTERFTAVRAELRRRVARGEPQGGQAVMRTAGLLPAPMHAAVARAVYNGRFFHTIVSYLSGARGSRWFAGAKVLAAYPVVPLTDRVPLTIGMLVSSDTTGVCAVLHPSLEIGRDQIELAVRNSYDEICESTVVG